MMSSGQLAKGMMETGKSDWPTLAPEAMYGLAGEIVKRIEPYTEADPAALLTQFLTVFGAAAGRSAYFYAGGSKHFSNLFTVLVGATAKGRKGTSWAHIERVFREVDNDWFSRCYVSGLSSGEGLIYAVRDPRFKTEQVKKNGKPTGETIVVLEDPGVEDKRKLVFEAEFTSVLQQQQRSGNILSAVVRQAWDSGNLQTLVKASPDKATGVHIVIIGHITAEELLRNLDRTECANGFANRFIWVCTRRSKLLPEDGGIPDLGSCLARLTSVLAFARTADEIRFDEDARVLWKAVYGELSEGKPGLVGAITSRGEAQVLRISMIYALLDGESFIRPAHLRAALALWEYCEASVSWIFGCAIGDEVADRIIQALRANPAGLTRTEIGDLFQRHQKADRIEQALNKLQKRGAAHCTKEDTIGRSVERWNAGPAPAKDAKKAH